MGPIAPVYLGSSGHQDETVLSDSRPEIHLGGERAGNKEKFCQKTRFAQMLLFFAKSNFKIILF